MMKVLKIQNCSKNINDASLPPLEASFLFIFLLPDPSLTVFNLIVCKASFGVNKNVCCQKRMSPFTPSLKILHQEKIKAKNVFF
jgi:hypothetical protein